MNNIIEKLVRLVIKIRIRLCKHNYKKSTVYHDQILDRCVKCGNIKLN